MAGQQGQRGQPRHILTIADVGNEADLLHLLRLGAQVKANPKNFGNALDQETLLMLFEKPSLRTRVSFEAGMTMLGGHAIFYSITDSPLGQKETWEDTGAVLSRLSSCVMARVKSRKSLVELSKFCTVPVVNGLDDWGHPCQMLADFMTVLEKKGKLRGLTMAYFGDTKNNVTYDLARACAILGINFRMAGPRSVEYAVDSNVIEECRRLAAISGAESVWTHDAAEAARGCDVIYTDSWMSYGIAKSREIQRREELQPYQVNDELMALAKSDCIFMNCLPAWRGNEQTASVIDGPQSVVFDEAENRKWAQMALLLVLLRPSAYSRAKFTPELAHVPHPKRGRVVVALGGNALALAGEEATFKNAMKNAQRAASQLAALVEAGFEIVVTHGNGPQIGAILLQNQTATDVAPEMPMPVCGAESQGYLGYILEQTIRFALSHRGLIREVVALVTQTEVRSDDPAFDNPSKPVGKFYSEAEAEELRSQGKTLERDDGGRGYRIVVPSPKPVSLIEADAICQLVKSGFIVIAGGGGGVPVVRNVDGRLEGRSAVIDKDSNAVLIAEAVQADVLLILTDIEYAFVDFKKPSQRPLRKVTSLEVSAELESNQFGKGSMEPKMRACVDFVKDHPGRRAIVTNLAAALDALVSQSTGTIVVSSGSRQ